MSVELSGPIPNMPSTTRNGEVIPLFRDQYGEGDPSRYSTTTFIAIVTARWHNLEVTPTLLSDVIEADIAPDDNAWHRRLFETLANPPTHGQIDDLRFDDPQFSTLLLRLERLADTPEHQGVTHPRRAAGYLATLYAIVAQHNADPTMIAAVFNKLPHPPPPVQKLRDDTPRRRR